ncbi:glutathione S-transferase family protein [Marinobacterium rhizophilum]|uniref:Glutathione S-transferase n=1 Tax=Marinobacterium rhizophilum TaxID=420402 RepID=A0ABY5HF73_9GAMM|nr:glutathione S-transferase [Marinobacterium rhizophilum]UTW10779.1 glutathione S-transferase [Marinobacterium rhizophilum]
MAIKIHDFPLSGHAHRVRLFASLIGADVELVPVDLAAGEHKTPAYLQKNRFGQVPLLEDGDTLVADSHAILVYLAKKFDKTDWLPQDPAGAAAVQRWLSVAAGQIAFGPAAARLVTLFGANLDAAAAIERAHAVLAVIDAELGDHSFITGNGITIADIALYSYIASAPEGNVDLGPYGNIHRWLARIEALPGFVPFEQSNVGLRQSA